MSATEHREPYEPRGSRTDLGARGGEIPLRDSTHRGRHAGLPIKCHVTPADVQDRAALPALLKAVSRKSPRIELAFVDGGYSGEETRRATVEASRIKVSVVKRSDRTVKGFVVVQPMVYSRTNALDPGL